MGKQMGTMRHHMRHHMQIRAGRPDDAKRLAVLATQVWLHTYATAGISDDIAGYALSELTAQKLSASLIGPESGVLVAECAEHLVGYAVVKFGTACAFSAAHVAELQTLYVQEHFIGCGVGQALLQAAQALARQRSDSVLWLTVNAKNDHAISFYAHHGYSRVGTAFFTLGQTEHENHVLVGTTT